MIEREIKEFNGSKYHNWTSEEGHFHMPAWLSLEDEGKLKQVIAWLKERQYEYYEEVGTITFQYIVSYARGEGRIVHFGPRKFFLPAAWSGSLTEWINHTQKYLTHEQAEQVAQDVRAQCLDWKIDVQHASQRIDSISPSWDEWRVETKGIWNGGKEWAWSINKVGDWTIYCDTMRKDHLLWYGSKVG